MECKFVVGQRVCCAISHEWDNFWLDQKLIFPQLGEVYTIKEITVGEEDTIGLRFNEIPDQEAIFLDENIRPVFWSWILFKPLHEDLIKILNTTDTPILEDA